MPEADPMHAAAPNISVDVLVDDERWHSVVDLVTEIEQAVVAALQWPAVRKRAAPTGTPALAGQLPETLGPGGSMAETLVPGNALAGQSVAVLLTDNERVAVLNSAFRQQDTPTNVLAFPTYDESEAGADDVFGLEAVPLGDLALAFEIMSQEAHALDKSLRDHTLHLCVHGTLHLRGYDHQDSAAAQVMEAMESAILQLLGVSDPYLEPDQQPG